MNRGVASVQTSDPWRLIDRTACLILLLVCSTALLAQAPSRPTSPAAGLEIRVTQILGFEGTKNNAKGKLSIQDNALQFKNGGGAAAQVNIGSIQDVVLGEQNRQVGGLPMTLGKAGVPYGGGRVISLFSHKKFDTLTLVYLDANGGWHGAIFQLEKGQGEAFRNELVAKGAHVSPIAGQTAKQSVPEAQNESK